MTIPRNLLIVRTDRIGDVVLSLPLAPVIKKKYPDCKITFLVRDYTEPLTRRNPDIDDVMILKMSDKKISFWENVRNLKKQNFDTAIMVYPTFLLSLIIFFSSIRIRIGTGYRWYSFLFSSKIYEHRKYGDKHELEYNLALLNEIGIKEQGGHGNVRFNIPSDEEACKNVKEIFRKNNIDEEKKIIILHPGSGGSAVNLPVKKFRELAELITSGTGCQVVLSGNVYEKELCENLVINNEVKNLAGVFNLAELIEVIRLSSIFISNSTGPLHIAAGLGIFVIGFYPKVRACSAERWGPYSDKSIVFKPEIDCEDCDVEQCNRLDCMSSINMNNVFENIQKILKLPANTGEKDAL